MKLLDSPVDKVLFQKHTFFVKRDDCLGPQLSGNKARKLYYLATHEVPELHTVISYGSVQSNYLSALSWLARERGWRFDYCVKRVPEFLLQQAVGNFAMALENGANIVSQGNDSELVLEDFARQRAEDLNGVFMPEGGAHPWAESGIEQLAREIVQWAEQVRIQDLQVFLPSGTGTMAVFLQTHLPFPVYTCACVGNGDYLREQWQSLLPNKANLPKILPTPKKYHFSQLYPEYLSIWEVLKAQTEISFDLLYDPLGWLSLLLALENGELRREFPIMYIHQGGVLGNETMLKRYKRNGFA